MLSRTTFTAVIAVVAISTAFSPALAVAALPEAALSKSISSTARIAEGKAAEPTAIRATVQAEVEELIVRAAPTPARVLSAIDSVFAACRPTDGSRQLLDWSCPATDDAYSALMALKGTIQALLESPAPAAIDAQGPAALSDFPTTNAGGANYRSI